jgi:LysM domain
MVGMRTRGLSVTLLAASIWLIGCVPEPANRPSQSPAAVASVDPTSTPTPVGPTPSPTYVRPTPRPLPSFLIHVVAPGESLVKIAERYGTSGRSIAYWNRLRYPSLDPDSRHYRPDHLVVGWSLDIIPNHEVDPEDLPGESATPAPGSSIDPEDLPDESPFVG